MACEPGYSLGLPSRLCSLGIPPRRDPDCCRTAKRGFDDHLDIRLNREVQEDVLRSIAMELKSSDRKKYERTFMLYYLPGMEVDAGGWASTHFNPDLEVIILQPQRK